MAETSGREQGVSTRLTAQQRRWLARGLAQAGGKLPLFDADGQRISRRTVEACIRAGWAEPWFDNPLKPDWLVCRLTDQGRTVLGLAGNTMPDCGKDLT